MRMLWFFLGHLFPEYPIIIIFELCSISFKVNLSISINNKVSRQRRRATERVILIYIYRPSLTEKFHAENILLENVRRECFDNDNEIFWLHKSRLTVTVTRYLHK